MTFKSNSPGIPGDVVWHRSGVAREQRKQQMHIAVQLSGSPGFPVLENLPLHMLLRKFFTATAVKPMFWMATMFAMDCAVTWVFQ